MIVLDQDILVVLSQRSHSELVCAVLAHYGINAMLAENVQHAILSMESHVNAFLLLDLDLEGAETFLECIVNNFCDFPPFLLVTGTFPDSDARIGALNLGADVCLGKPIDGEEVFAVIKAILRRAEKISKSHPFQYTPCIRRGELIVDPLRRSVSMRDEPVSLTVKEFDILYLLISYPDIVFSKAQIYERVWHEDYTYATTSVSDHISSLRKKLGLNARDGRYIQTVFGVGYCFTLK